jgi:putative acetyltransferase
MNITRIRPLAVDDAPDVADIFFRAVHEGTRDFYTDEQRTAWAGERPNPDGWRQKISGMTGFVAEADSRLVGFMTIDADGYIDLAFVLPIAAGTGIGWQLYKTVEEKARALGVEVLTTEASMRARPFFERQGWSVVAEQTVVKRGVGLTNFRMKKVLSFDGEN